MDLLELKNEINSVKMRIMSIETSEHEKRELFKALLALYISYTNELEKQVKKVA